MFWCDLQIINRSIIPLVMNFSPYVSCAVLIKGETHRYTRSHNQITSNSAVGLQRCKIHTTNPNALTNNPLGFKQ